jgi:hypothetical protein
MASEEMELSWAGGKQEVFLRTDRLSRYKGFCECTMLAYQIFFSDWFICFHWPEWFYFWGAQSVSTSSTKSLCWLCGGFIFCCLWFHNCYIIFQLIDPYCIFVCAWGWIPILSPVNWEPTQKNEWPGSNLRW